MNKLEQARAALLVKRPFYGSLALQLLKWRYDETLPYVAATDGKEVIVNQMRFDDWSLPDRMFVAAHEVMHVVYEHCFSLRRYVERGIGPDGKPFNPTVWAIAIDYIVNGHLMMDGFQFSRTDEICVAPPDWKIDWDTTAVEVYCKLNKNRQPPPKGGGSGQGQGKGGKGQKPAHGGFDDHQGQKPGTSDGSEETDSARQNRIANAVGRAIEVSRQAGNIPEMAKRMLGEIVKPKFSLKDALMEQMLIHGRGEDFSYRRPKKRALCMPPHLFLPSTMSVSAGKVVVGIDVSGSIDQKTLTYFASVLIDCLQQCSFDELWVATIETDVLAGEQLMSEGELLEFFGKVRGGGGTHMPALFPWIDKQGIQASQVIILTDGYTDFGKQPSWPVCWCVTTDVQSPWGRTLHVELPE